MKRFWDQLTKGQKDIVKAGMGVLGALLLFQFAIVPYLAARRNVRSAIAASEKSLRELAGLGAEYDALTRRSEEIRQMIGRRAPDFALFSYLERRAGEAGVKANIRALTPLKSTPSGAYEETGVEMKMDKLTMKQLTDFLYLVESKEEMIRIRKISITKMKESPDYVGLLMQVSTFQPLSGGGR